MSDGVGPWQLSRGSWKDNNPLGWDAENFILDNCQYVVYVRKDPRFACVRHWDEATQSPKVLEEHCPTCWGFGRKVDFSLVPARITLGPAKVSPKITDLRTDAGLVEYYESAVHFPRKVCPRNEDLVLVCEFDTPAQELHYAKRPRVVRVATIYLIKQINDRFERELAFYSCGVEGAEVERSRIERGLPYLRNLEVLETLDTWTQSNYW